MTDEKQYLKVSEVAGALSVKPITVNQLIKGGHLPALNVSAGDKKKAWRVHRDDLIAFIESRRTAVAEGGDAA